jgi:lipoprotein-releasing system permease protein
VPYELTVALRYLTAKRKQAFISVISAISVIGVAVGVMAVLISLGLMTGLQGEIRSRILGATAHLTVYRNGGAPFEEYRDVVQKVREVPGVLGSAPAFYGKGLITSATGSALATLKGIRVEDERSVTDLQAHLEEGSLEGFDDPQDTSGPVLLGRELAGSLNVGVGDVVSVTSPQGRLTPMGVLPRVTKFRVAGIVRTGLFEFDSSWAYLPLASAQRMFGEVDRATLVEVRVKEIFQVRRLARDVLARLGEGYVSTDWIQMNQSLFSALWLEKTAIALTIGLIVMVAALNIVATLVLMVMEKHKDIAILVSMGASRGAMMRIFMLQGTVIGAVGTTVGATLGVLACHVLDRYQLLKVPEDVYQISHVPFRLLPGDAAIVILGALLICFVATLHPARGAAKLDPAEALRYE